MCSGLLLSQRRGAEEISRTAAPPCGRPVNRGSLTAAGVVPNFDPPAYYDLITTPIRVNAHSLIVNAPYFHLVRGALPSDNISLN